MSQSLVDILTLISGICWSLVYVGMINRGFRDKTYGMPLFALAFNIAWEFIFGFLIGDKVSLQKVVNITWFLLDAIIVYTYFRYGRKDFPKPWERFFVPWSVAAFAVAFVIMYFTALEFEYPWGAIYSAFTQNLMMSILFIAMLVRRGNVDGQSIYIAVFKWLGTLAPTIQIYFQTGHMLVLVLGAGCFIYDVIYIAMLYRKFTELALSPLTRRPVASLAD